jgi:hypothetical protein
MRRPARVLGGPLEQLGADLDHDLGHVHRAAQQIDAAAAQAGQLSHA